VSVHVYNKFKMADGRHFEKSQNRFLAATIRPIATILSIWRCDACLYLSEPYNGSVVKSSKFQNFKHPRWRMVKVNWKTVKSLLGNCLTHRYHATLPILCSILIKDIYNIACTITDICIWIRHRPICNWNTDICNLNTDISNNYRYL